MTELEKIIGYRFKDRSLLDTAMTHSSYSNERGHGSFNERLEFLGDSVLGFIAAEYFYRRFPDKPEGELTRIKAAYVCEKALYGFAGTISLGSFLKLGHGEELSGGRSRPSVVSDAFEALIAAIYLDGGIGPAKEFVLSFLRTADIGSDDIRDYKSLLQERVQRDAGNELVYCLVNETGPAHAREFTVDVSLNGNILARGVGTSKKRAEQQAAKAALAKLGE